MKRKKFTKSERACYDSLLKEMKKYEQQGVDITLSEGAYSLEKIASECILREHGSYMGDYIWDESGKLKEIRYDKIDQNGKKE